MQDTHLIDFSFFVHKLDHSDLHWACQNENHITAKILLSVFQRYQFIGRF